MNTFQEEADLLLQDMENEKGIELDDEKRREVLEAIAKVLESAWEDAMEIANDAVYEKKDKGVA